MDCLVCNASSAGYHYQASCCRACAAFFRRTVYRKLRYKCSRGSNCDVTNKNRFSCRFCRMKKCVEIGMVMNDDPSPCFDFHMETNFAQVDFDADYPSRDDFYSPQNVFGDHGRFLMEFRNKIAQVLSRNFSKPILPITLTLSQQLSIAQQNHSLKWPDCKKENVVNVISANLNQMFCDMFKDMEYTAEFCMEIQDFAELPLDQRTLVFKHFIQRYFQMDRVFDTVKFLGNDLACSNIVTARAQAIDFHKCTWDCSEVANITGAQLRSMFLNTQIQLERVFTQPFKRLHADDFELAYLLGCAMWYLPGVPGLSKETIEKANLVCERFSDELNCYYKYERKLTNYATRIYKLHNLIIGLDRVAESREQDSMMMKMFELFKVEVDINTIA